MGVFGKKEEFIEEPSRKVPVLQNADVVIAGGGISGVFAAIAAGRTGADTVLIDRFGIPGGNMGPGMIAGGGFHPKFGYEGPEVGYSLSPSIYGDLAGIPREFIERYATYGGGAILPYRYSIYMRDSNLASHVALEMLEEAEVTLMLSCYAGDPILEGNRINGLYVESKSGREAVRARVTVDATGEADLARRAGLPVLQPKKKYHEIDGHSPNGMGIFAVWGGIDCDAYEKKQREPVEIEVRKLGDLGWVKTGPGLNINFLDDVKYFDRKAGIAGMRIQLIRPDSDYDPGNGRHISQLEQGIRRYILDTAQYFRKHVPGFKNAYVLRIAPFLGTRGGPCIDGEHTLTSEDCRQARLFDDVMYRITFHPVVKQHLAKYGEVRWTDVPYRVMIPKNVKGFMAVGRSASSIPDTLLRNRIAIMHMGQAGGVAAALAARDGISPGDIAIGEFQENLLEAGFNLGDRARLRDLGLA